jgi:hypothetical protein
LDFPSCMSRHPYRLAPKSCVSAFMDAEASASDPTVFRFDGSPSMRMKSAS